MEKNKDIMNVIGDYDIVIDDPKKHVPWAIFCTTIEAVQYMQKLKRKMPIIKWQTMKLEDWAKEYMGQ